jgi:hypothetical protein
MGSLCWPSSRIFQPTGPIVRQISGNCCNEIHYLSVVD